VFDHTYRTTEAAALAAYRAAVAARDEFTAKLHVAIAALGAGKLRPLYCTTAFGGPIALKGLEYLYAGHVPWGWRVVNCRGTYQIEPKSSGAGAAAAKRWLAEHQPSPDCDPRYMLKGHGITYQSRVHFTGGRFNTYFPSLFEYDGALWIWYRDGAPDADFPKEPCEITWERVPVEEMQTAYAATHKANTNSPKEKV
jgi:hypothetical protein